MAQKSTKSGFEDVPSRVDVNELEEAVLKRWEKDSTFEQSLEQNKDGKLFTFYDGPPYATGLPHYGHVLQSSIKDAVLRYRTMRGDYVPRRVGWDTHGLPVEVLVEKELGLKTKKDVEEYGIEKFNQKCREAVFRYIDEFTATLKRLGRWADYDNAYATLNRDYMESEWWVFKNLWDKNLVYKDFRSTPYCIRCATPLSNFETGMGYKDRTDQAVYVKLQLHPEAARRVQSGSSTDSTSSSQAGSESNERVYLLIWTTTPWTLPGNVAVAFNPELKYVSAELEDETFILATDRVVAVLGDEATVTKEWSTEELAALTYEPPYQVSDTPYSLAAGEFVTADEGTGLVHMAPAFGTDDAELGKRENLPTIRNVGTDGTYVADVTPDWLAGVSVFDANKPIIEDLKKQGVLLKREAYRHSYPHCWRCDTPLIYYALDTWFVRVTEFKDNMLKTNEEITWIPEHIKQGRFAKGIESAPDWSVSRNRFWSVPIPIWECDSCEERVCVGSVAELKKLSRETDVEDIHRPYVDDMTWQCTSCDGTMQRIPEVLDVWFDSGSMPYAQWHYPFENKEFVEDGFPADFIAESIEMTRAWFYTLHVLSTAVKGSPAFKNVIGSGIIFGADGNKLSKKLKNYPEIGPTLEQYGADTVRMFFLRSTFGEPYVFSDKELRQLHRSLYQTLWNVYSFFVRYANVHDWAPPKQNADGNTQNADDADHILDRWILARLKQLENEVTTAAEKYRFDHAARAFEPFIDDLSNWYVRQSRDRFQPTGEPDAAAFATLHEVLVRTCRLLAPFMPFITEDIYRNLTGEESVHLSHLSDPEPLSEDEQSLVDSVAAARAIVSEGLAVRAAARVKVRQPLAELVVDVEPVSDELTAMITDELNVKTLTFGELPSGGNYQMSDEDAHTKVALNTEITDELKAEGIAREIIRHGQLLRRKADLALDDRITLSLATDDSELQQVIESQKDTIMEALQADNVIDEGPTTEVDINTATLRVGVTKQ